MHTVALDGAEDPDRESFTRMLRVARRSTASHPGCAPHVLDVSQRQAAAEILFEPLGRRRLRSNPRVVKRKMSNFPLKRPDHRNYPRPTRTPEEPVVIFGSYGNSIGTSSPPCIIVIVGGGNGSDPITFGAGLDGSHTDSFEAGGGGGGWSGSGGCWSGSGSGWKSSRCGGGGGSSWASSALTLTASSVNTTSCTISSKVVDYCPGSLSIAPAVVDNIVSRSLRPGTTP